MKKPQETTVDDLEAWLDTVDPMGRNPMRENGVTCLYNGPNGTHCIAGQFMVDHGADPKKFVELTNALPIAQNAGFPLGVANRLSRLQAYADGQSASAGSDVNIPVWGNAIDQYRKRWDEVL